MMNQLSNNTTEIKSLLKYLGIIITVVAAIFGSVQWMDSRYVDQRIFELHQEQQQSEKIRDEERMVQIFEGMERERERDLNLIHRAIRDASMTGLIIRRDTLLARGRQNLSDEKLAELDVLQTKLQELQID